MLEDVVMWLEAVVTYWLRFEAHHLAWDAATPWPVYRAAFLVIAEPRP